MGVSGWSYDGWKGRFYPPDLPARRRLEFVAESFSSVEINGSFYSLQKPSSYLAWHDGTPRDFLFAVKGSRFISHNLKLGNATTALANFFASGVLRLGRKLGPILWQLPRRLRFDRHRVTGFFDLLPRDTHAAAQLARRHDGRVPEAWTEAEGRRRIRYAIEPRHESFFGPEFASLARRAGIAIAFADSGDWPYTEELTARFVYLRLHGSPRTYASRYSRDEIERWADRVEAWREGGEPPDARRLTDRSPPRGARRDVYVYFDNDYHAYAPANALELAERLKRGG